MADEEYDGGEESVEAKVPNSATTTSRSQRDTNETALLERIGALEVSLEETESRQQTERKISFAALAISLVAALTALYQAFLDGQAQADAERQENRQKIEWMLSVADACRQAPPEFGSLPFGCDGPGVRGKRLDDVLKIHQEQADLLTSNELSTLSYEMSVFNRVGAEEIARQAYQRAKNSDERLAAKISEAWSVSKFDGRISDVTVLLDEAKAEVLSSTQPTFAQIHVNSVRLYIYDAASADCELIQQAYDDAVSFIRSSDDLNAQAVDGQIFFLISGFLNGPGTCILDVAAERRTFDKVYRVVNRFLPGQRIPEMPRLNP